MAVVLNAQRNNIHPSWLMKTHRWSSPLSRASVSVVCCSAAALSLLLKAQAALR